MTYKIMLWCGAGYWMNAPIIVSNDETDYSDDLSDVLAVASIKDKNCDFIDENNATDEIENDDERYLYLDRSQLGYSNGYLLIENARIERIEA